MINAAIAIWSDEGTSAVTMRRVCAETSVNDRYFYEEFGDKDSLLVAAWQTVSDNATATLTQTFQVWTAHPSWTELTRQVATAFMDWMTVHPRYARILLSHNADNPSIEQRRTQAFHGVVSLVMEAARPRLQPGFDEEGFKMDAVAAVGGFIELLRAWQSGFVDVDARRIVEHTANRATRYRDRTPD